MNTRFGRGVMRLQLAAHKRRNGTDSNNGSAAPVLILALINHLSGGRLTHVISAEQINLHSSAQRINRHIEKTMKGTNAGIGDKHIHTTEIFYRCIDKTGCSLWVGNIALKEKRAPTAAFDFFNKTCCGFLILKTIHT